MESAFDEILIESIIWNLQIAQNASDDASARNMRTAKARLKKFLADRDAALLREAGERAEMWYRDNLLVPVSEEYISRKAKELRAIVEKKDENNGND